MTIAVLLIGGVLAVLWKMQLLPFVNTQDSEAVGCGGCCPSFTFSFGKMNNQHQSHGSSPSRMERLKAKATAFSRLWGAMGWYRYPLYNRHQKTNRSSGEYFFGSVHADGDADGDADVDEGDEYSFELMNDGNMTSRSL